MREYQCSTCSYIYEPTQGDPTAGISPGTPWQALPFEWACPHCGIGRNQFAELRQPGEKTAVTDPGA